MNSVFSVSFFAVLKLLLGVLVGCILGKTGIMPADARRSLSKIILWVMLPCMLITSLCKNISIDNVRLEGVDGEKLIADHYETLDTSNFCED